MGQAESNLWLRCGIAQQKPEHLIWGCSALKAKARQHERCDHELASFDSGLLPTMMKYGVPSAMHANLDATFWGTSFEGLPEHYQTMVGGPLTPQQINQKMRDLVAKHASEVHRSTPIVRAGS